MRILFSLYVRELNDDKDIINEHFAYEYLLETKMSYIEIWNILDLYAPFDCDLLCGNTLSFWDISCEEKQISKLIAKIKSLPQNKTDTEPSSPKKAHIIISSPGNVDFNAFPSDDNYLFYRYNEQEEGAGGIDTVIAILEHPIVSSLIANLISTFIINAGRKLFHKGNNNNRDHKTKEAVLNIKKFYSNLSKTIHSGKSEMQITDLCIEGKRIIVKVRTKSNDYYEVYTDKKGVIKQINELGNGRNERLTE